MSKVKIKNEVGRALVAAAGAGVLPKGVAITSQLTNGELWLNIESAPFNCLADDKLKLTPHGYQVMMTIGGGDSDNTPEAQKLIAEVKRIAGEVIAKRVRLHVGTSDWIRKQATATRAGRKLSDVIPATHTGRLAAGC